MDVTDSVSGLQAASAVHIPNPARQSKPLAACDAINLAPGQDLDTFVRRQIIWRSDSANETPPPPYSTDIAAAFEVERAMLDLEWALRLERDLDECQSVTAAFCHLDWPFLEPAVRCLTIPHAICVAAIRAVSIVKIPVATFREGDRVAWENPARSRPRLEFWIVEISGFEYLGEPHCLLRRERKLFDEHIYKIVPVQEIKSEVFQR